MACESYDSIDFSSSAVISAYDSSAASTSACAYGETAIVATAATTYDGTFYATVAVTSSSATCTINRVAVTFILLLMVAPIVLFCRPCHRFANQPA